MNKENHSDHICSGRSRRNVSKDEVSNTSNNEMKTG